MTIYVAGCTAGQSSTGNHRLCGIRSQSRVRDCSSIAAYGQSHCDSCALDLGSPETVKGSLTISRPILPSRRPRFALLGALWYMRRVLWPVFLGALIGLVVLAFNVLSSTLAMTTAATGALGWVLSLARASVPIGFLVGLLRMRMDKAAVATLVVGLQDERRSASLERSIADALHDPVVKLGYWSSAARTHLDSTGKMLRMPRPGSGLSVTLVNRADQPLGAIIDDAVLDDDKALLDAMSAAFALAVDRDRLAATVHAQASSARQLPGGPMTFRYADVEGSTVLLDRLGERYAHVLAEERRLLRTIVRRHGGGSRSTRAPTSSSPPFWRRRIPPARRSTSSRGCATTLGPTP
jgi:hypothetical protein